jgi:dolichol kinase
MTATISAAQRKEVLKALRQEFLTPVELGRRFGLPMSDIHQIVGEALGLSSSYPHIISIRPREAGVWPNRHGLAISAAKELHDNGVGNLTYFYGKDLLVMYCFPRAAKISRKPWFFGA